MSSHFLQLNSDKTETLVIGAKANRQGISLNCRNCFWKRHTGQKVILDSDLNFQSHINSVVKTRFYHLRNIGEVRSFIAQEDAEKLGYRLL